MRVAFFAAAAFLRVNNFVLTLDVPKWEAMKPRLPMFIVMSSFALACSSGGPDELGGSGQTSTSDASCSRRSSSRSRGESVGGGAQRATTKTKVSQSTQPP